MKDAFDGFICTLGTAREGASELAGIPIETSKTEKRMKIEGHRTERPRTGGRRECVCVQGRPRMAAGPLPCQGPPLPAGCLWYAAKVMNTWIQRMHSRSFAVLVRCAHLRNLLTVCLLCLACTGNKGLWKWPRSWLNGAGRAQWG